MSRIAAKRFRSAEERAGFPSKLKDDPMVNIASYNDKPFSWNKDAHNRYNCTPTNTSYKVLRGPGPGDTCPLEAKLVDPENPLCCASKVGANPTHQESLEFFKSLKNIFALVPAHHRVLGNYPPNLRRLLQWVTSPTNASEVATAPAANAMVLNTEHPRFLDLVKFAMMSRSHIEIKAAHNTGPPPNALLTIDPFYSGANQPFLLLDDRIPQFHDLIRINNETGTTWQVSVENHTPPASVLPLPPIRSDNFAYGGESPMFAVDLADIVTLFDNCDNNGWNPQWVSVVHRAVIRPNLTITQGFTSLLAALSRLNRRRLYLYFDTPPGAIANGLPPVAVPPGYGPVAFPAGQFTQLVTALMQSVNGFNLHAFVPDTHYVFEFNSMVPPFGIRVFEMEQDTNNQITMIVGFPAVG